MVELAPKWAKPLAEEGLAIARAQLEEIRAIRKALDRIIKELPVPPENP